MTQTTRPKVIFFDLDSTLFDHHHSLCCAMSEARRTLNIPDTICLDTLTDFYNQALDQTYGSYRSGDLKRGGKKWTGCAASFV
jgi:putative hydrolase of the HAD superfamily